MKYRCCNCSHIDTNGSKCSKCGSNSLETLSPANQPTAESAPQGGPQLLCEVPDDRKPVGNQING